MFNISFASFRDWGATPRGYVLNTIIRVLCHVGMTKYVFLVFVRIKYVKNGYPRFA